LYPGPEFYTGGHAADLGMLFFGTTTASAKEAMDHLRLQGCEIDGMRLKAAPFSQEVLDFILEHETVFVVEQNRDGQMRNILINELEIDPRRLISVLNYDGFPITADNIIRQVNSHIPQTQNAAS
jgi:2-oxoglutarate ferredoxin oxidoreductase subunit alpha